MRSCLYQMLLDPHSSRIQMHKCIMSWWFISHVGPIQIQLHTVVDIWSQTNWSTRSGNLQQQVWFSCHKSVLQQSNINPMPQNTKFCHVGMTSEGITPCSIIAAIANFPWGRCYLVGTPPAYWSWAVRSKVHGRCQWGWQPPRQGSATRNEMHYPLEN